MTATTTAPDKPPQKIKPKLRHSLRVTVSALLAFGVMHLLHIQQGVWLAFSAMQVVQQSVGGSVKAVFERTLGTFAGAAYGALVAWIAPHFHMPFWTVVIAGIGPAAFLAALYPSFRIAPITVAIILFGHHNPGMSPSQEAIHRVIEIGIGCLVGMAASLAILPSRAHRQLSKNAAEVLDSYAALLLQLVEVAAGRMDYNSVEIKHAELRATITKMETQGEDAQRERKSRLTDHPDPDPLLRMIRRLRFDLVMIGRAVNAGPLPPQIGEALLPPLSQVAAMSAGLMRDTAGALGKEKTVAVPPALDAAYDAFAAALSSLHRNQALATLGENELARIFTLSFTLEQLKQNLHDLAARSSEFGEDEKP